MTRRILTFAAIAISMLFGAGFAVWSPVPEGYTVVGAVLVALAWIAVGVIGREPRPASGKDRAEDLV